MLFSPGSKVGAVVFRDCDYEVGLIPVDVTTVVEELAKAVAKK
jgi:hypothetical protein